MLTLFALVPVHEIQLTEDDFSFIGPRIPDGWELQREGDTGWFQLLAPNGLPHVQRRIMLFDMTKQGFAEVLGMRVFMVLIQDRMALSYARPLLAQVPWWGTTEELRDIESTEHDAQWKQLANLVALQFGAGSIRPSSSLAGYDAIELAENTKADDILSDAILGNGRVIERER